MKPNLRGLKKLLRRRFFLIGLGVFAIGAATGFFSYSVYQYRLEILVPAAFVFAGLTWLGSGADFLGLLREWYKQIREEEATPTLEFDDPILINHKFSNSGKQFNDLIYLIGLSNIKKTGMVERCHALLFIEGTYIRNWPLAWFSTNKKEDDISIYSELRLFEITEFRGKKEIVFYTPTDDPEKSLIPRKLPYDDIIDKKLTILVGALNGKLPERYEKTIKDIVKESRNEGTLILASEED